MRNAELAAMHKNFAASLALRFHGRLPAVDVDDLVSEALWGLVTAADRFRSGRNITFTNFVAIRIRGRMRDFVRYKVGIRGSDALERSEELSDTHTTEPDLLDNFRMLRAAFQDLSTTATVWRGTGLRPADSARFGKLIRWYYVDGFSYQEIGELLGVKEPRVWQLHREALRRMRTYLELRGIRKTGDIL